ncbi:hypothetical protein V8F06_010970 [Rhypophila decipiens]
MPKLQQTFTLIDPTVRMQHMVNRPPDQALPELAPWMTSKQAQKLHREKTKQPRVSREEQRRLEREEQKRIKDEFDKEKSSKRARFLRDKKKEKEQKALEAKRKKGLPLVDVRPSQPTISWLVRPNGATKRKVDEVEGAAAEQIAPRPHPSQRAQRQQACENTRPAPSYDRPVVPDTPAAPKILSQTSPTASRLPTSSQLWPLRDITNVATPAPPASTQFVIEHLEDFLPTSSQMDRELEEEYGTPMAAKKPTPAPIVSRPRPPVPLFSDSGKGKSGPFVAQVPIPLATRPAPAPPSKMVDRIKNVADFLSSQDWELNSEDILDLEGTTNTPCRHSKAVSPVVAAQPPVITTEVVEQDRKEDRVHRFHEPPISPREARRRSPEDFAPLHESQQSLWDCESLSPRKSQSSQLPPEPSLPKLSPRGSPKYPVVAAAPKSSKKTPAAKKAPYKTSSPIRFFGSSDNGIEMFQALAESRILAAAEEEKRKEAERRRLAEEKLAEERLANEVTKEKRKHELQQQAEGQVEEIANDVLAPLSQCSILHDDIEEHTLVELGPPQPAVGAEGATIGPGMAVACSQAETDYGDDDFDELEEETLTLLDAVTTTTTAAANNTAARQVTAQDGTKGNAVDYTVSFSLNDDSWLSDDDSMDFCNKNNAGKGDNTGNASNAVNAANDTISFNLNDDSWLSDDDELDF